MVHRNGWMFVGASAFTGVLLVWSSLAGCQPDGSSTTYATTGSGSGGNNSSGTGSSGTGSSGTGSVTGAGGNTSSNSGAGGQGGGSAGPMDTTIKKVAGGFVGPKIEVKLTGVVAMSQKFPISSATGGSSGNCLWGVFVSEPNLTETAESTGILVVAQGFSAAVPDGGTKAFCPRLSLDPTGDSIPDDVKPGDVLDIVGLTDNFLLTQCATQPNGSTVGQYQISKATSVTKTGTAPVPAPHVMTEAELVRLASPTDKEFHDKWGGVRVRITNITPVPQDSGTGPSVIDGFGHIFAMGSNLQIGDKIYYRGYLKAQNFCFNAPAYTLPVMPFTSIDGFHYLDFCTWSIVPNDKCADLAPPSSDANDCNGSATACAQ